MTPVQQFTDVTEAALAVGHRTYSGTVAATERVGSDVSAYTSVTEAAMGVGHRTYSGTVAATSRTR